MAKLDTINDENFVFGAMFMAANKIDTLLERELNPFGVTSRQWFLSICVASMFEQPPTLKDLANVSGTTYQNVKQVALKLQTKKLMTLFKDPKDARVTRVALTQESAAFWASTEQDAKVFMERLYEGIDEEAMRTTRNVMQKLMENMIAMEKRETK
jgi:MarR family transcriptional regulator for hemolysin